MPNNLIKQVLWGSLQYIFAVREILAYLQIFSSTASTQPKVLDLIAAAITLVPQTEQFIMFCFSHITKRDYSKEFVQLLLHKDSRVFNWGLMDEKHINEYMLMFVSRNCPKLEKIVLEHSCKEHMLPMKYLEKFTNLQHIQLNNFVCDNSSLDKIARCFPRLKYVLLPEKIVFIYLRY
jgi:hypothetical protein